MKKKIIFFIIIIIVTISAIAIYFILNKSVKNEKEANTAKNITVIEDIKLVDLSRLDEYIKHKINNDKAIELLNKIKDEYSIYLSNATENGTENSTGLYLYFSNDTESNKRNLNSIINLIDNYISTRENDKNIGYFDIETGVDDQNRQYILVEKIEEEIESGLITEINEDSIFIKDKELDYIFKIDIDENSKLTNYRTEEDIDISDVKVGDYYVEGKIVRNISEDEWKKECLKNMAYCFDSNYLYCGASIEKVENMGDYVIMTFEISDSATEYFNEDNKWDSFELKAIAYPDLEIPTHNGGVTVYNVKEKAGNLMTWIELDKNTIDDKYPVITTYEVYDG